MEIKYEIRYEEEVIRKHIPALSTSVKTLIKRAIEEPLMVDPVGLGKTTSFILLKVTDGFVSVIIVLFIALNLKKILSLSLLFCIARTSTNKLKSQLFFNNTLPFF